MSSPEPIPLRSAEPGDLAAIHRLLQSAGLPDGDVGETLLSHFVVAVSAEGELIGAGAIEPLGEGEGLLRSLVVAPAARGQALGRHIVAALRAERRGWSLYLLTTDAEDYFAAQGWQRIDRAQAPPALRAHAQFAGLCPASAVVMCRLAAGET